VARRIGSFSVSLYASPHYVGAHGEPEKPEDVIGHQAVMIGTESWKFADGKKTVAVNPQGRFKSDSAIAIAEAIAAGVGIGALPDIIAESYTSSGKIAPIMTRYRLPEVGIFVVRPPGAHVARKVRVLIDLLAERFG